MVQAFNHNDASLPTPMTVLSLSGWAQHYLDFLRVERRLSANTLESYARDLALLHVPLQSSPTVLAPLITYTPQQIKRSLAQLHSKGLSPRSIARILSAWRGYFAYAVNKGAIAVNPTLGLKPPKAAKTLPQVLSPDEAVALVDEGSGTTLRGAQDAATTEGTGDDGTTTIERLRDHAMFELLYSSGLRVSELTDLNLGAIDTSNGLVRVTGKGGKTRIVPIGAKAVDALNTWFSKRYMFSSNTATDVDAAFLTASGQRVYPRLVQRTIKKWAAEKGISQDVHPHMLRHCFASHVLQSSGNLRAVQEMLGHASITSTQVYTHLDFQHLAKVYDVAHPRARIKK